MKILLTSAYTTLAQYLADSLAGEHEITMTHIAPVKTKHRFVQAELGHDKDTNELVRGMDAIIHTGKVDPKWSDSEKLDYQTRRLYNLLWAASEEKVAKFIYLGSLRVMFTYPEEYIVTERWKPSMSTDVPVLCHRLGEYTCREFAREHKINAVCLRLGDLVFDPAKVDYPKTALYLDDMLQSVQKSLTAKLPTWALFHIQSQMPDQRFITTEAQQTLGFVPARR
ncbi:MAG: NAD(P)-dependent oxidoreductase [SAR202 cluster bacterium]|nr:NAD(P)-dependent oxidoreductase [SAR202 cluster bacterium]